MDTYSIGNLAQKIVAVRIDREGHVTPYVRHRQPSGRMVDVLEKSRDRSHVDGAVDFVARVGKLHPCVVSLEPPEWFQPYSIAAIPLGGKEPFSDREVDYFSTSEASYSGVDEVHFHLEAGKLSWESENVSGEAVLNEIYPQLDVILRLPAGAGAEGEIEIGAPVLGRTSERASRLLSAA